MIVGSVVPGFAFLGSALAVFSGAQLFALGVIGEYLARMHTRLSDRPSYVVRESVGPTQSSGIRALAHAVEPYAEKTV